MGQDYDRHSAPIGLHRPLKSTLVKVGAAATRALHNVINVES